MNGLDLSSSLVTLKDQDWFARQKIAGQCVATILKILKSVIDSASPNISLKDLESLADAIFPQFQCTPTFKGYKGFPGSVCLSVNNQLVHGIPTDYQLQPGDVVKVDLGATYQGAIADAALTTIYGASKSKTHTELVNTCKTALEKAIASIAIGKQLGCIGYAIHKYVSGSSRFGLITNYGGHGINENQPHAPPFVWNKSRPEKGVYIQPGLTLAIEPMLVIGDTRTRLASDGWTVLVDDMAAHFEHTIFVGEDKVHVMTSWE